MSKAVVFRHKTKSRPCVNNNGHIKWGFSGYIKITDPETIKNLRADKDNWVEISSGEVKAEKKPADKKEEKKEEKKSDGKKEEKKVEVKKEEAKKGEDKAENNKGEKK